MLLRKGLDPISQHSGGAAIHIHAASFVSLAAAPSCQLISFSLLGFHYLTPPYLKVEVACPQTPLHITLESPTQL